MLASDSNRRLTFRFSRYGVILITEQRTSHGITRRRKRTVDVIVSYHIVRDRRLTVLGFAVMSGVIARGHPRAGQVQHLRRGVLVLPDKEFRYLRHSCYYSVCSHVGANLSGQDISA